MTFVLAVLAGLHLSAAAVDVGAVDLNSREWRLFDSFVTNHSRSYRSDVDELYHRFQVFQQSLERHRQLNAREAKRGGAAVYGINKFSDLTPEEFKSGSTVHSWATAEGAKYYARLYLSGLTPSEGINLGQQKTSNMSMFVKDLPQKFDWSAQNVIGPVLDQEKCGSCWAFAVVETVASAYAIKSHHLYQLSPQQLISCDYNPAKSLDGCRGGSLKQAFETIRDNKMVIVQESIYPFSSKNGETYPCKQPLPQQGLQLVNHSYCTYVSEENMRWMLVTYSPLTTSVNAITWQDYIGGIIQHHCTGGYYDHAIQIVGYDLTGDVPYWRIRNTWGTDWGEQGYVRVLYGSQMCGLNIEVTAVVEVVSVNL